MTIMARRIADLTMWHIVPILILLVGLVVSLLPEKAMEPWGNVFPDFRG
jgi:hypothetical protein